MPKPALFVDLASGDSYQFAAGREDTLQIQNLTALVPASSVDLFIGASGNIALGGPLSSTIVEGAAVSIAASNLYDVTFSSRGSSLTFNQSGAESLVGFAPSITSFVAALNDVKSSGGVAGLQSSYALDNTISMTVGRNLVFSTFDGVGPANFIVQNSDSDNFISTDGFSGNLRLGDGSIITVSLDGLVDSDLTFKPGVQYRYVSFDGTVNGTPASPDAMYIKGAVNGINTAGADVYIVAERNVPGAQYGGEVLVASYLGPESTGTLASELSVSDEGVILASYIDDVRVESSPTHDIGFLARGGSITVNELGAVNLVGFTATSIVGALNEVMADLYSQTLQQAYAAGNTIDLTSSRNLTFTTFDGAGPSNFVVQNSSGDSFFQSSTITDSAILGDGTTVGVNVAGRLVSNLMFHETDPSNRSIWLSGTNSTTRTLTIHADKSPDSSHGASITVLAVRSPAVGGDGGDVRIASYSDTLLRSHLDLRPNGGVSDLGLEFSSYGRALIEVDPTSPVSSPMSISNTIGPITVDATGGPLTFNATGNPVLLDCTSLNFDSTSASYITSTATFLLGATNDLTFSARGYSITLNQASDVSLDPFFTATSVVGALNELVGAGGVGTLQQSYTLGNTISMTASRHIMFTTFDGAGASNFVVQNSLGRLFIQTDTASNSTRIGDVLLDDVVFSGRGASLTFNQVGNTALVGFNLATTSVVAALNELKSSPSGGVTATYTTAEPITLGDVVYMTAAGTIGVADQAVVGKDYPLGFSTQSVGTGVACVVSLGGEVHVKTSLVAGDLGLSAFLSTTGDISTTAPGSGTLVRVGMVVASGVGTSKIALQVGPVVVL